MTQANSSNAFNAEAFNMTRTWTDRAASAAAVPLSSVERSLVRLLALGYELEDAAISVGLSPADADLTLRNLQDRCGVASLSRLLALAVLRHWV